PETAVLAAAAQSAAAIGTPAMEADAAREAPEASGIDDLRARIEQTKAAVREALEKPFSADETGAWEPEGPATAFAPGSGGVGDESPILPAYEETAAVVDDQSASLDGVRSAFAEGSDRGVWVVPDVVAGEPAETPFAAPPAPAAAAGPETPTEAAAAMESVPQADPPVPPEFAADAESRAEAATAEASVWEPAVDEEPAVPAVDEEPAVAAAAAAAAQVAPPSQLDQAVADAFTLEEEASPSPEAAVVDQAEMRRRIEETRGRLKAKAFDAMTSGEAALLAHEPLEATASAAADEPLDEEVQAVIDRSLSQDDY
ncbi:MAG: hypothetical protein FJ000_09400, partial [Actinobacteria bacterium]|nr:hypothetical protein [Actinomycetota bacterium]